MRDLTLREAISNILGVQIPNDKKGNASFLQTFENIGRDGRMDMKKTIKILALLCEHAEDREKSNLQSSTD